MPFFFCFWFFVLFFPFTGTIKKKRKAVKKCKKVYEQTLL